MPRHVGRHGYGSAPTSIVEATWFVVVSTRMTLSSL